MQNVINLVLDLKNKNYNYIVIQQNDDVVIDMYLSNSKIEFEDRGSSEILTMMAMVLKIRNPSGIIINFK